MDKYNIEKLIFEYLRDNLEVKVTRTYDEDGLISMIRIKLELNDPNGQKFVISDDYD